MIKTLGAMVAGAALGAGALAAYQKRASLERLVTTTADDDWEAHLAKQGKRLTTVKIDGRAANVVHPVKVSAKEIRAIVRSAGPTPSQSIAALAKVGAWWEPHDGKFDAPGGDVKIGYLDVTSEEQIQDLLDAHRDESLDAVTRALATVGAEWVDWADGEPGSSAWAPRTAPKPRKPTLAGIKVGAAAFPGSKVSRTKEARPVARGRLRRRARGRS